MIGERVFVYWDLHRECFSLKSLKTGRVLNYEGEGPNRKKVLINRVVLSSCEFRVQQKGRWKVVDTGVKNVHAGVVGTVISLEDDGDVVGKVLLPVRYNPVLFNTFVWDHNRRPIYQSDLVIMENRRVWAF